MKKHCQCCNRRFVLNSKKRKEDIKYGLLPEDTENCCDPCIRDIAGIEAESEAEFWEQSLPLSSGCGG